MDIREQKSFFIGDWRVTPDQDVVSRDGRTERLEPLAMQVLVYLASRAGEVVPRQELEEAVWKGAVVSYDAITSAVIKLRKALGDNARDPRYIATVPKRGYQLIATVSSPDKASRDAPVPPPARRNIAILLLALVTVAAAFLTNWSVLGPTTETTPTNGSPSEKPSIAVLPFVNISGDPEQEYLGDGIADDLITELSRVRNMVVIARSSSFKYRGQTPSPQEVGTDLGVSHLLEGSVRKSGGRLRITVRLVDASNGHQLWAERFDRVLDDIFFIQDEITRTVVSRLSVELVGGEPGQLGRPAANSFAAYDLFLQGYRAFQGYDRESNDLAQTYFRKAIAVDENFGRAYGALAVSTARGAVVGWHEDRQQALQQSLELAERGVKLSPYVPQAYWSLGYTHWHRREFDKAIAAAERSVDLAPNYADGFSLLGLITSSMGRADDAIAYVNRGMKLNPSYTWDYPFSLGRALYFKGDYEAAIEHLEEALERNNAAIFPRLLLAAALINLDRLEDAEWQVMQVETDHPEVTLSSLEERQPVSEGPHKNKVIADLRAAGMAE
jgi:TolB-like protein/DNA-binding winged helix-turn-helix (wHTH) protein